VPGAGGSISTGSGGTTPGGSPPDDSTTVTSGCACSFDAGHSTHPAGSSPQLWLTSVGLFGLVFARRRRKRV
jgi:hypothetical protein